MGVLVRWVVGAAGLRGVRQPKTKTVLVLVLVLVLGTGAGACAGVELELEHQRGSYFSPKA
jgi:hypothetical protein